MRLTTTPLVPAAWRRLGRRGARLRLTVLYASLFLLSATVILAATYLVEAHSAAVRVGAAPGAQFAVPANSAPGPFPIPRIVLPGRLRIMPDLGSQIHARVVAQHSADLGRLLAVSLLALAVMSVFSALLGWIAAGRVLRPLRKITSTAQSISARNLHERLALAGPNDEFKALGDTLDDLLGRLEASFEAQRRFVANASHELRTPLTVERTLLQVALADPNATAETLRSTCEELLACGSEQERLLESLLTLASSERGLDGREPLDLSVVTRQALLTPRPEIEDHGLHVHTTLAPAPITGDPALLERLVANLIDNAVHYNVPGGRVELRTSTDAGQALLTISNTGPLVATQDAERLFEPFARLGSDRARNGDGCHGLGLSIVRAIATAHTATVSAQPQPEGGLAVAVGFLADDRHD